MSHRPWESPSRHNRPPPLPPPPPPSQRALIFDYSHPRGPPPPPPPQHQLLPPISDSPNPYDPGFPPIKRRRSSAEVRHPLTNTNQSLPSLRTSTYPYQPTSRFNTASSLAPFVAQLHDIVQRLTASDPLSSAITRPTPPSEFNTLDKIGASLESVCQQLYGRILPPATSPTEVQAHLASLTIAHENLKHETGDLKRQLDRSKVRAETLSKKMDSLEKECEKERIEKEQIQAEKEQLEESVDELREERDEARKGLNSQGEQWGVIVRNAGRIEQGLWGEVKRLRKAESQERGGEDQAAPVGCGNSCAGQEMLRRRIELLEQALERCRLGGMEVQYLAAKLAGVGTDMAAVATGSPSPSGLPSGLGIGVG